MSAARPSAPAAIAAALALAAVLLPLRAASAEDPPTPERPTRADRADRASTLEPGDRLVYDVVASFGLEASGLTDPCALEARVELDVRTNEEGLLALAGRVEVASVVYEGPYFAFAVRPAGEPETVLDALRALGHGVSGLRVSWGRDRALNEVAHRLRLTAAAAASLHGATFLALVRPGERPWISIVEQGRGAVAPDDLPRGADLRGARLLRALVQLAFPPIPPEIADAPERFEVAGAPHQARRLGRVDLPFPGPEVRTEALAPTAFAGSVFAYDAVEATGEGAGLEVVTTREWARVRPGLGVAARRRVRAETTIPVGEDRAVTAIASWHAWLRDAAVAHPPR